MHQPGDKSRLISLHSIFDIKFGTWFTYLQRDTGRPTPGTVTYCSFYSENLTDKGQGAVTLSVTSVPAASVCDLRAQPALHDAQSMVHHYKVNPLCQNVDDYLESMWVVFLFFFFFSSDVCVCVFF